MLARTLGVRFYVRSRLALYEVRHPFPWTVGDSVNRPCARIEKSWEYTLHPRAARTLASSTCTRTRTCCTSSSVSSRIPIELWATPSTDRTSTRLNTVLIKDIILDLPDLVGGGF